MKLKKMSTSKGLVTFEKNWTAQHDCLRGKPMVEMYNVRLNKKFLFKLRIEYMGSQGLEFRIVPTGTFLTAQQPLLGYGYKQALQELKRMIEEEGDKQWNMD